MEFQLGILKFAGAIMINMIKAGVVGVILGAGVTFCVTRVHVLNTEDGLIMVPRSNPPELRSAYVDVRKWNASMWQQYPDVTEAVVESGRSDLLVETGLNDLFSSNDTSTDPRTGSDASEIVKSLVPIRFEDNAQPAEDSLPIRFFGEDEPTSEAREGSVSSRTETPEDKLIVESAPQTDSPENPGTGASELLAAIGIQQSPQEEVLPQGIDLNQIRFPELQHPIPIESDPFLPVSTAIERTKSEIQLHEDASIDKVRVRDLIQSLIPKSDQSATDLVPHSAAKAVFPIDLQAPEPGDILPPDSWLTKPVNSQAPTQVVRPF